MISPGKKSFKYFIGYINDHKIKPFTVIFPKTSAYVKSYYAGETKLMYFEDELSKNMMKFGIKSPIV